MKRPVEIRSPTEIAHPSAQFRDASLRNFPCVTESFTMPVSDNRPLTDAERDAKVFSVILEEIALNGRTYFSGVVSVSLVDLARAIEKRRLYDPVTQDNVLVRLKQLHNLGRIRLEDVRLGQQSMKQKKYVAAVADVVLLKAPYKKPKRRFAVRELKVAPGYDLTKKEREVLRNALTVMRVDRSVAREFARLVG